MLAPRNVCRTGRKIRCLKQCRGISSEDSSRPFPSPFPTRPAQQQQQQQSMPIRPSSADELPLPTPIPMSRNAPLSGDNLPPPAAMPLEDLSSGSPWIHTHHFDTYQLLKSLERQGFSRAQAEVVMKGIKFKLRESSSFLRRRFLLRSDLDNETYLFKAGLTELRTEIQTMRRTDIQMLQAEMTAVTRDVEAIGQKLREDVGMMKNDITLDLNNRKNDGREELKAIDMKIQEMNNKLTVSLGDVKTGIEAVRWETIWKGMSGVAAAAMTIAGLGYLLTRYAENKAEAIRIQKQKQRKQLQEDARRAGTADMEVVF
ncbi:hypothetical protein BX666DRAFT_1915876 [Dichotomocladium elegans]|nr:hypothetical protein BX666DRAFT_1915876 [Dichotomocladium elegans]